MSRVAIIGSGGAGKTTLARALSKRTGLPVIHLDKLYWNTGWIATPQDVWLREQQKLLAQESWIIDGNYGSTLAVRLAAADTVVFLDTPRLRCLCHVLKRQMRYLGRSRPDMTEGCPERLTGAFLRWIWDYPQRQRPKILQKLAALEDKQVVRLQTRREVSTFLETLPTA